MSAAEELQDKQIITEEFLYSLYGEEAPGHLILFTINKSSKKRISYAFPATIDGQKSAAAKGLMLSNNRNLNIYYGIGLQRNPPTSSAKRGDAGGVIVIPGFWMDIDVKGPGHAESDLPETFDEAIEFAHSALPLQPTMIIKSGGGLQAYWLNKEPCLIDMMEEWELINRMSRRFQLTLKEKALEKGWKLDGTADLARIFRLPGTFNNKLETPVPVEILEYHPDRRYNSEDFDQYLLDAEEIEPWDGNVPGKDFPPVDLDLIEKNCKFMRNCHENASETAEPAWYAWISIVGRCENGRELAHVISSAHRGYNRRETDIKLTQALESSGPRTCSYIKANFGSYCEGCKKKVTSPIVLGLPRRRAYFNEDSTFVPMLLANHIMEEVSIKYAAGQFWIDAGGVYHNQGAELILQKMCQDKLGEETRTRRIAETLDYIKRATHCELPSPNLNIINVLNGRLNWRSGELLPHDPTIFELVQLPVIYDPSADCPGYDRYLETTLDPEIIPLIDEVFGYCLIPDTKFEKTVMLTGQGQNGKSVLLHILIALLGKSNCANNSLHALEENQFRAAELVGKLANIFADLPSRALKESEFFKMLVTGDPLTVERKFRDPFDFCNYARLIFSANQLPRSTDNTYAFYRRWIIIPFTKCFNGTSGSSPDRDLKNKLTTPAELSGILNRSLMGLRRLYLAGSFTEPAQVKAALAEYQQENDSAAAFASEYLEMIPMAVMVKQRLYNYYRQWCELQGLHPLSQKKMKVSLKRTFPDLQEGRDGRGGPPTWIGIRLTEDAARDLIGGDFNHDRGEYDELF